MKKKTTAKRARSNNRTTRKSVESPVELLTGELRETPIADLIDGGKTSKEKVDGLAGNIMSVLCPNVSVNSQAKDASPVERIAGSPIVSSFSRHNLTWKKVSMKDWLSSKKVDDEKSEKGRKAIAEYRSAERALTKASKALRKMSAKEKASLRYSINRKGEVRTSLSYEIDETSSRFIIEKNTEWQCQLSLCSFYDLAVLAIAGKLHSRDLAYVRAKHPAHFDKDRYNGGDRWDRETTVSRLIAIAKGIQDSPNYDAIVIAQYSKDEDERNKERAAKMAANAAKAREAKAKSKCKAKASTSTKKRTQSEKDASLLREAATASQVRRSIAKAAAIANCEKKRKSAKAA